MNQPKREKNEPKTTIAYIPHGVNHVIWHNITDEDGLKSVAARKRALFGEDADHIKFVVLYNSRNIRRKMTSDVLLAYQKFLQQLPEKQRDSCRLVLHTQPVDENGTDLIAVLRDITPDIKAVFSEQRLLPTQMVELYNVCDVVISLTSNEGFGIGTLEAIMSERMIIANVTGGLQDQLGFVDDRGQLLDPRIHFNLNWGTNADGKFQQCGEWAVPVFPNNRALIGSPSTPYIFDDRCDWNDAAVAIRQVYDMSPEERARRGKLGREFALNANVGMSTEHMCDRFIQNTDFVFDTWAPNRPFDIYTAK